MGSQIVTFARYREAAQLDQATAAARLEVSRAKIGHIESAKVKVRPIELRAMCAVYGVPQERVDELLTLAREARQKGWWDSYAAVMPETLRPYVGLETAAAQIRSWEPQVVFGLLQTPAYTRALADADPAFAPSDVDRWVQLRIARQEVLTRAQPVTLHTVLDEAALRRVVGGPSAMRSQLAQLLAAAGRPNITIQVMPFATGAHPALAGPFIMLGFPEGTDNDVIYIENQTGGLYLEKENEIARYHQTFDRLQASAASPEASLDLIRAVMEDYQ